MVFLEDTGSLEWVLQDCKLGAEMELIVDRKKFQQMKRFTLAEVRQA
jgi:hypothetical protein